MKPGGVWTRLRFIASAMFWSRWDAMNRRAVWTLLGFTLDLHWFTGHAIHPKGVCTLLGLIARVLH